jgi:uncharacterized surface protein with fasciclin (FAS1) repeats
MNVLKAVLLSAALSIGSLGVTGAQAANIVDTAVAVGTFNTLIAATAAGLADALATTENLTVFAPTDEAFAALPAGTVEDLLKPENKDKLAAILTLHVLPRVLKAYQMLDKPFHVKMLNATERLTISASASGVMVSATNSANVVQADVQADNGVIYVIDAVLLP